MVGEVVFYTLSFGIAFHIAWLVCPFEHRLKCRGCVRISRTKGVGTSNNGIGRVAIHDNCIRIGDRPLRQTASLLVIIDEGLYYVADLLGEEHCNKRYLGAINIPPRKVSVLHMAWRERVNLVIKTNVLSVHITEGTRKQQRVVQRGIEDLGIRSRAATYLNLIQSSVPMSNVCC